MLPLFLLTGCTALLLAGCSTIASVQSIWPRDHDPALVSGYVQLQINLEKVDCNKKETFNQALLDADWLNRYAEFRDDPQKVSTKAVSDNLKKAYASGEAACKRWINLSNVSMKTIKDSWSGR